MRSAVVALAAALAAVSVSSMHIPATPIHTYGGCKFSWKGLLGSSTASATFDVTNLTLTATSQYAYMAHDTKNEQFDADKYEYTFNVCGDVPGAGIPAQCGGARAPQSAAFRTKLAQVDDDQAIIINNPDDDYNKFCEQMTPQIGGRFAKQTTVMAALHDPDRPAHGWTIAYPGFNGIKCKTQPSQANQTENFLQFRHIFICEDLPNPTAQETNTNDRTIVLNEDGPDGCFIDVYMHGHAGCPLECPVVNGTLCGGNGICDYDRRINQARCFCYDDFMEHDCMTPTDPKPTGLIVVMVFLGFGLAGGVVFAYWYYRVRGGGAGVGGGGSAEEGYYEAAEG